MSSLKWQAVFYTFIHVAPCISPHTCELLFPTLSVSIHSHILVLVTIYFLIFQFSFELLRMTFAHARTAT